MIEHGFEVSISTDNHKMEVNIHSVLPLYDNGQLLPPVYIEDSIIAGDICIPMFRQTII